MKAEVKQLAVDEATLHVEAHGQGPLMVLITGMGAVLDWWRPAFPLLASTHRVLAHDLRGVGRSSPAADVSVARQAADVLALADSEGASTFSVVGASFGAQVVQELLCCAPERVTSAALLCGGPARLSDELLAYLLDPDNPLTAARRRAGVTDDSAPRDRLECDGPLLFSPSFCASAAFADFVREVSAAHACHAGPESDGYLAAAAEHDRLDDLARVRRPVLAVIAEQDVFVPAWSQRATAEAIPTAQIHAVAEGRHGLPVELPELWAPLVLEHARRALW